MINFNKLSGLGENVATTIKKAQNAMSSAFAAKPNASSAKKLAGSLDGLAAQNKALSGAQNKAELIKLGKLRQTLRNHSVQLEHLDNNTLRKIEKEAQKISNMSLDELEKYGCSPTDLPHIAAAKKIIKNPYSNASQELAQHKGKVGLWLHNRGYDTDKINDTTLTKITKKTQEYEANMRKSAAARGMEPTGDPLGDALKHMSPKTKPVKLEKTVTASAAEVSEIKTLPVAEELISAGKGDIMKADELKNTAKSLLEPKIEPGIQKTISPAISTGTCLPSDYKIGETIRLANGFEVVEPIINPKYLH